MLRGLFVEVFEDDLVGVIGTWDFAGFILLVEARKSGTCGIPESELGGLMVLVREGGRIEGLY